MELNGTIFVQIVIFLSLLLLLSRMLFAPILRLFDERERRIEGAKKIAAELLLLADEKAKIFAAEYERAKIKARHALTEQKHEIDREFALAIEKSKAQAKEKLLAAEADLYQQEKNIREDLHRQTETIANDMVDAMMRKPA